MSEPMRGHLAGMLAPTPPIYRYPAMVAGVRYYWIPVWDIPEGQSWPQRTLPFPHPLVVVADSYARFYGVASGLSGVELSGSGWAFGTAFKPSSGVHLAGGSMLDLTDRWVDLSSLHSLDGAGIVERIRSAMTPDPHVQAAHQEGIAVLEQAFAAIPADPEGQLVDAVCEWVETTPGACRVGQICDRFGVGERQLQRLLERRIGLTPKWLIRRRRLQEAAQALRVMTDVALADLAHELGYADQAHFTRDFTAVVGLSPRRFRDRDHRR
ncbi:MAG TPA: helix-turn-helix domain-containing protein [Dermatophilaceae bacterium]|nr:helix-turn-helix domain-containing protein [Dermatophilaceae bacterium]